MRCLPSPRSDKPPVFRLTTEHRSAPARRHFHKTIHMKAFLFICFLTPLVAWTNPLDQSIADISKAIRSGDAATLGTYFDGQVELATPTNEDVYDKAEAIRLVKQFFTKYPPGSFSQVHQGTSKSNDFEYIIGNMTTGSKTFRVYFYMRRGADKYVIQELRFDEE